MPLERADGGGEDCKASFHRGREFGDEASEVLYLSDDQGYLSARHFGADGVCPRGLLLGLVSRDWELEDASMSRLVGDWGPGGGTGREGRGRPGRGVADGERDHVVLVGWLSRYIEVAVIESFGRP